MTDIDLIALIFMSIFILFAYTRGTVRELLTFVLWLPMIGSLIAFMYNSYDPSSFYGYEGVDRDTKGQMRTVSLIFLSAMIVIAILDKLFFKNLFKQQSETIQFLNGLGGAVLASARLYIFALLATTGFMIYSGTTDVLENKSKLLDKAVKPYAQSFYKDLLDRGYISETEIMSGENLNDPFVKLHNSIQNNEETLTEEVPLVGEISRHLRLEQYNKAMRERVLNRE